MAHPWPMFPPEVNYYSMVSGAGPAPMLAYGDALAAQAATMDSVATASSATAVGTAAAWVGSGGTAALAALAAQNVEHLTFADETLFYSLVERHQDGRPDMIGMEAVNQLLVALEVHRFDFCFIGAGYEKEVDEFLTVNPGLAGRFNRKLRFESYTPDELVEIAVRYGEPRATIIEPAAREALNMACKTLRAHLSPDGRHGIDVMHNGRFARNVVERAERLRDSRVAAQHRSDKGSVTVEDLETLRTQDITAAVIAACAEKHVALQF